MHFRKQNAGLVRFGEYAEQKMPVAQPLPIRMETVYLRTLTEGRVNLWMAPALRGMILKPLRDHFCGLQGGWEAASSHVDGNERPLNARLGRKSSHDGGLSRSTPHDGNGNGKENGKMRRGYCEGCAKITRCLYGRVFEPDLKTFAPQWIDQGARQGLRGITLATNLLTNEMDYFEGTPLEAPERPEDGTVWLEADEYIPVRLLCVGRESIDLLPLVVEALDVFGRESGLWGKPNVRLAVDGRYQQSLDWELRTETLPTRRGEGTVPSLTLHWVTPLSLKLRDGNSSSRRMPSELSSVPSYQDIFAQSVRTVRRAVTEFGSGGLLDDRDWSRGELLRSADGVRLTTHNLRIFEQVRGSRRNDSHRQSGWLGAMTFAEVPTSHIPWLVWASRFGIGDSRNMGTGLWTMELG